MSIQFESQRSKLQIQKADELEFDCVIMTAYGPIGSGKTFFGASGGKGSIIISVGEGLATLQSPSYRARFIEYPDVIIVRESPIDVKTGIFKQATGFDEVTDAFDIAIKAGYTSITLDDATFFSRLAKNLAIELNSAGGKSQTLNTARETGHVDLVIQDFGREITLIDGFLSTYIPIFRANKINFIMLAHERKEFEKVKDEKGRIKVGERGELVKVYPAFTGQTFPEAVTSYFDEVWNFRTESRLVKGVKTITSHAKTSPDVVITTKTRYGGLFNPTEINPTIPDVVNRVRNHVNSLKEKNNAATR